MLAACTNVVAWCFLRYPPMKEVKLDVKVFSRDRFLLKAPPPGGQASTEPLCCARERADFVARVAFAMFLCKPEVIPPEDFLRAG